MYKKIAIDIDNTITNLEPTLWRLAEFYDRPVPSIDDILEYNLSSVFGFSESESREFWEKMEYELCDDAECSMERVSVFFDLFADFNTEVYIITNRDIKYYDVTKNWLNKNIIPHKELIMTSGESKVDVLRELGIELMIDDKPSLFEEVAQAELDTKMVCIDYPYNKGVQCDMRLDREGNMMINVH